MCEEIFKHKDSFNSDVDNIMSGMYAGYTERTDDAELNEILKMIISDKLSPKEITGAAPQITKPELKIIPRQT